MEGAVHADKGKCRLDLIPPEVMWAMGDILSYGATKYEARGWEKGIAYERIVASLLRHLYAWYGREDTDKESGLPHIEHALVNLAMLVTYERRGFSSCQFDSRGEIHE